MESTQVLARELDEERTSRLCVSVRPSLLKEMKIDAIQMGETTREYVLKAIAMRRDGSIAHLISQCDFR